MRLRSYQQSAVDAVYDHLRNRDDNPVVVLPTGAGKSLVLAKIASDAVQKWNGRVLILAHVKELLEQNADKVRRLCPGIKIGLYSAGLKKRDTSPTLCRLPLSASVRILGAEYPADGLCRLRVRTT